MCLSARNGCAVAQASTCHCAAVPPSALPVYFLQKSRTIDSVIYLPLKRRAFSALSRPTVSAAGQQDVQVGGREVPVATTSFETVPWGVRADPRVIVERS